VLDSSKNANNSLEMPALALAEQTLGCGSSKDAMELVRAVRHALNEDPDLDSEALFALDDVRKHVAAKPRRGSSKRKTTPAVERRGEYDSEKCGARIWFAVPGVKNTGYSDIQCSSRHVDGCFCKKHAKQDANGLLWCGVITEDPPENPVKVEGNGNEKEMYWYKDEDGESSPKPSAKTVKVKKDSPPWKPAGANTEPSLEEQVKENQGKKKKSPKKKKNTPKKDEEVKEKKPRGRPKKKKDENPASPEGDESPVKEKKKQKKQKKQKQKKSPAKEKVDKVDKELGEMDPSEMSMGQLQALMAAKKMMEQVKEKDDEQLDEELNEDTADMSDGEDELEEIDFEGIGYLMNDAMTVIDPVSMEEVGNWDAQEEEIEWIDDDAAEEHAERVSNL